MGLQLIWWSNGLGSLRKSMITFWVRACVRKRSSMYELNDLLGCGRFRAPALCTVTRSMMWITGNSAPGVPCCGTSQTSASWSSSDAGKFSSDPTINNFSIFFSLWARNFSKLGVFLFLVSEFFFSLVVAFDFPRPLRCFMVSTAALLPPRARNSGDFGLSTCY